MARHHKRLKARTREQAIREARRKARPCWRMSFAGIEYVAADGAPCRLSWTDLAGIAVHLGV